MKKFLRYFLIVLVSVVFMALTVSSTLAADKALAAPSGSPGKAHNAEGIKHYDMGHWDVAGKHFGEAIMADKKLAEAHYNLALALHNQALHGDATPHFREALKLASDNPSIAGSPILINHLKK